MYKHNLTPVLNLQRKDKKGLYPLRIRSTIKGVVDYHPTGIMLKKEDWDAENLKVINLKNRNLLNLSINSELNRLEKLFLEQNLEGNNIVKIKTKDAKDFYAFADAENLNPNLKIKKNTIQLRQSAISVLKQFKSKLFFAEITPDFMQKYENFLRERENMDSTINKHTTIIKTFITIARAAKLIKKNPLEDYTPIKFKRPPRSFLSSDLLQEIENFSNDKSQPENLRNAANWFLFSCFSGLRWSDAEKFNTKKIIDGQLIFRTEKTDTDVSIFVHEKLNEIIQKLSGNINDYYHYRRELLEISKILKLDKPLKTHKARHTFAVHSINKGMSMEAVGNVLGHTDIKTTQIYGQVTNTKVNDEIKKAWDKKNPV